jgi:predicted DsbA family dithiol-disulfide isomerase
LRREYEIQLKWRAFPLHPETPKEGMTLEKLFEGRMVSIPEVMARLRRVAEAEGLPLGERKMTFNSRLAQELGKWAESKGKGEAFDQAAFRAYFVDGINIALIPELLKLAASVGLPEKEAKDVLETRSFREAVDSDWERARKMGITMVPTFMVDGDTLVGAQPYPVLERFMDAHNIPKRNQRS